VTTAQFIFLLALSASLLGVALFSVATVRSVVLRRAGSLETSWAARVGTAIRSDNHGWAFLAHRVSGVAVFAFLAVHVADVFVYSLSPATFDEIHHVYGSAPMRVFECLLLFAILFHAFYGLRLIALDLTALGAAGRVWSLRIVAGAAVICGAAGSLVILGPLWR
jgi:succinate dehydrogenase / fumarate reductase cytochrome b subunit